MKAGGMFDQKLMFLHVSILCGVHDLTLLYFHSFHRKTPKFHHSFLRLRQIFVSWYKSGEFVAFCEMGPSCPRAGIVLLVADKITQSQIHVSRRFETH